MVLEALAQRDPDEVLAPRETNVSVLFCDLRGFSRNSEESADRLLDLLARVSDALGVMTHHFLHAGGVVGDFHGDAAMGFWGWPINDQQAIYQACTAALAIRMEFDRNSNQRATLWLVSALVLGSHRAGCGWSYRHDRSSESDGVWPGGQPGFAAGRHDQAVANFDLDRRSDRRLDSAERTSQRVTRQARRQGSTLRNANIAHGRELLPRSKPMVS